MVMMKSYLRFLFKDYSLCGPLNYFKWQNQLMQNVEMQDIRESDKQVVYYIIL